MDNNDIKEIRDFVERMIRAERENVDERFRGSDELIKERFRARDEATKLLVSSTHNRTIAITSIVMVILGVVTVILSFKH